MVPQGISKQRFPSLPLYNKSYSTTDILLKVTKINLPTSTVHLTKNTWSGRPRPLPGRPTRAAFHQEVQLEQTAPQVPLALGPEAGHLVLAGAGALRQAHQAQVAAGVHLGNG